MLKILWLCNHRIIYCNYWSLFRVLHVDICSCSSVCVPLIIVVQTWCVLVAMLSMVYCVYYTRPQGKSSKVRNMPLNACSKWLIANSRLENARDFWTQRPVCRLQSLFGKYTRRRKYVSISKRPSLESFVQITGILCSKFETTLFKVWDYFVRSSALLVWSLGLLHSKFGATSYEVRLLHMKCVHTCQSTSYKVWANFERTSSQLRAKLAKYELHMVT